MVDGLKWFGLQAVLEMDSGRDTKTTFLQKALN